MGCRKLKSLSTRDVVVEFHLQKTATYCGGARPSDEMLAELSIPKPLADYQFYIKAGDVNDPDVPALFSSFTDDAGLAYVPLKPGKYLVVFEDKQDWTQYNAWKKMYSESSSNHSPIDTTCLLQWIKQPEFVFEVVADSACKVEFTKVQKCFWNEVPCLDYTGSIPP
jgi:hypothetical protein